MADDKFKIHVDDDWKAQAQAEKDRLAREAEEQAEAGFGPGGAPPADFRTLLSTMITQALFALGAIPDPATGQRMVHLELAKHHIDMLAVLEEKTKGNLNEEEQAMLSESLAELRQNFVAIADQVRAAQLRQASGANPGSPGAPGIPGAPPRRPSQGIIDPNA